MVGREASRLRIPLQVRLETRRFGTGNRFEILKWAEAKTRAQGKKYLRLNCIASDRKIRDYYEKAGFGHVGDVMGSKALASLYEKLL